MNPTSMFLLLYTQGKKKTNTTSPLFHLTSDTSHQQCFQG